MTIRIHNDNKFKLYYYCIVLIPITFFVIYHFTSVKYLEEKWMASGNLVDNTKFIITYYRNLLLINIYFVISNFLVAFLIISKYNKLNKNENTYKHQLIKLITIVLIAVIVIMICFYYFYLNFKDKLIVLNSISVMYFGIMGFIYSQIKLKN